MADFEFVDSGGFEWVDLPDNEFDGTQPEPANGTTRLTKPIVEDLTPGYQAVNISQRKRSILILLSFYAENTEPMETVMLIDVKYIAENLTHYYVVKNITIKYKAELL